MEEKKQNSSIRQVPERTPEEEAELRRKYNIPEETPMRGSLGPLSLSDILMLADMDRT